MYVYQDYDRQLLNERVAQFRDQTRRYLDGQLSDDEFLPLRLQNGLYIQRYAPMLRVSVPYGMLNSTQLRTLGHIARTWDKGYAHVSTRQNIQYNWPELAEVPDILAELAEVEMHSIQTSGNCIRNTTTDQFAGVSPFEIEDSRPVDVTCIDEHLTVTLADGRVLRAPLWWYPRLDQASPADRAVVELMPMGIHWPELDEDISVASILRGEKAPGATPR